MFHYLISDSLNIDLLSQLSLQHIVFKNLKILEEDIEETSELFKKLAKVSTLKSISYSLTPKSIPLPLNYLSPKVKLINMV